MNPSEQAPKYIRDIAPYQPGKPISEVARELGLVEADIIKLASNENPLGISAKAAAAIAKAIPELSIYPDGNGFALKQAIAAHHQVAMNQIALGNGSNDLIELAARSYLAPGLSAVYSQYGFAVYPLAIQAVGCIGIEVRAKNFGHDLDAMLAAIRPDTRLIYLANPNNPTGTFAKADAVYAFLKQVPQDVLVYLDEAYVEYTAPELKLDSVSWIKEFDNLIVSRTFSKAYGLAGLRVGFALGQPALIDLINRVRQPFNVNLIAQVAAIAALGDTDFVAQSFEMNQRGMAQLIEGVNAQGLEYIPSFGNFLCIKVGDGELIFQRLMKQGVIVRPIASYGMPEYLRVTVGTHEQNVRFLAALKIALAIQGTSDQVP